MSEAGFQLFNEESSLTGGKSVSEIVQILRTNANLKLKVSNLDDQEDVEEIPNNTSQIFPWLKKFTAQCKDTILEPDIKKLDDLITSFLKHIEDTIKECYKRPKRAYKLKTRILSFLQIFNMIYGQLKQPLEHTTYLDKMSNVMALYIDIELKSSRRGREHPKKIAERICTSLFIFLDKSLEHILDTVLKAKFFIKKYSDICCPIMARLLKETPGPIYEATYVRYVLAFKLWKKLAGKDQYASINKDAVRKLTPPPDLVEKLKTGLFSNVLPYVSKSEKDRITMFFMQSPFNVKKKAQVFLKDEKRMQPSLDLERSLLFDDDLQITSFFDDDSNDSSNQHDILLSEIWSNLVDSEDDCFDTLLIPMETMEPKEEENVIVDIKKTKPKEKPKKNTKNKATNGVMKTSKKRKSLATIKNFPGRDYFMDFFKNDVTKLGTSGSPKEENSVVSCVKAEDPLSSLINNSELKQAKPCATVEPEQCKEVTDSLSNIMEVIPVKLVQNPITTTTDPIQQEATVSAFEEQCSTIETSDNGKVGDLETIPTTTVESNEKPEDATILEENFVAEEVVICSDMEQETACSYLFLDSDNINQNDIMNVIGIAKGSESFCNDEFVVNPQLALKHLEKQQIAIGNSELNTSDVIKTKENISGSPENPFLYSMAASTESYVTFSRRQDSYACNEMLIQKLFSEPTSVDDGSDEDSGCQGHRRFASGGKRPAFREHMEESKSENDEDFEPLTPSSESLQQSPQDTSLDTMRLIDSSPTESYHDIQLAKNCVSNETPLSVGSGEKDFTQEKQPDQIKELSVHLSRGDVLSAKEHISIQEKLSPQGMFPPDTSLHFKTVDSDIKYQKFQNQLYSYYKNVENILETDPVPFPQEVLGYSKRCPCPNCANSFGSLMSGYLEIRDLRASKIVNQVDKERMLTKYYDKKIENEKLINSIAKTMKDESSESIHSEEKNRQTNTTKDETIEESSLQTDKPESIECSENKNEYASLPPKKRKAFSVGKETDSEQPRENEKLHSSMNKKSKSCDQYKSAPSVPENDVSKPSHPSSDEGCFRFSPVKIKAVDGRYCVLNEFSSEYSKSVVESDYPDENIPKSRKKKCKKHRKHDKERKEHKRLKRLKKQEEGLHN